MEEKKKSRAGRKSKLTPELQSKIVEYIKAGNYAKTACMAVGICEDTYYDWLKKGKYTKGRKSKYVLFSESIQKAHAEAEVRNAMLVNKAAQEDAKHAEWWLERTNWKKWGRKDHVTQDIKLTNTDIVRKWVNEDGSEPKDIKNRKKSVQKTKPADVSVSGKNNS